MTSGFNSRGLFGFFFVLPILGLSSASATVVYVAAVEDGLDLIVTAVTDTQYAMAGQHTAFATAWASSPSGRTVSVTQFQANIVQAIAVLPIDPEDGTFQIANLEPKEWCPFSFVTTFYNPDVQMKTVGPWVQLVRTSKSKERLQRTNDSADVNAEVKTSPNCLGQVQLWTGMGKNPTDMRAKITAPAPDGDGIPQEWGAYATHSIVGGSTHNFVFRLSTLTDNTKAGSISATADIYQYPSMCTPKGPSGSYTNTQVLTVE